MLPMLTMISIGWSPAGIVLTNAKINWVRCGMITIVWYCEEGDPDVTLRSSEETGERVHR